MKNIQRVIRGVALIALFVTGVVLFAQEATPEATEIVTEEAPAETTEEAVVIEEPVGQFVRVVGSGIVNPAVQALINDSGSQLTYDVVTTGSEAGFEEFCAGTADATTAPRPISVQEDTRCRDAGVSYLELLVGYDVMVFVSNPADDFLTCLTTNNINRLFAPSAVDGAADWSQVSLPADAATVPITPTAAAEATAEVTEEAVVFPEITLLLPQDNTITYATLDGITAGFGLRQDAVSLDAASIVETVAATSGAVGVVPLGVAQNAANVNILNVDFSGSGTACTEPTIENVEAATYNASTPLYLYVSEQSQDTLAFLLNYITDATAASALANAGYLAPSSDALALNRSIVSGEASARAITAEEVTYEIPPNLTGTVNIVGASSGFRVADAATQRLTSTQTQLTINNTFNGQTAGINDFCNGIADILFVNGNPFDICANAPEVTPEADAASADPVTYEAFELGQQAVVLVANANETYASCLTREQITSIWSSASTDTVTTWSDVAEAFPETPLILVGVNAGNVLTDILLTPPGGGASLTARVDVAETNNDPSYRAAAVGNVPGALVYMSWSDYQSAIDNGQENIQLVAVDAGSGCVVPSETTIADGSYALARSTTMLVKTDSLATVPVQAFIWTLYSDSTYGVLESLDFVTTIATEDLPDYRTDLLALYETVEAEVFAPEVTPEATAEATEAAADD